MGTENTGLHQKIIVDDINFICESLGSVGDVCVYSALGNVEVAATGTALHKVAGLLGIGVVNRAVPSDVGLVAGAFTGTTNYPKNHNANETHISGQVRLFKIGELETTQTVAGAVFGPGSGVYLGNGGGITNVATLERIGTALSAIDSDGVVKISLNIN